MTWMRPNSTMTFRGLLFLNSLENISRVILKRSLSLFRNYGSTSPNPLHNYPQEEQNTALQDVSDEQPPTNSIKHSNQERNEDPKLVDIAKNMISQVFETNQHGGTFDRKK
jgi:hypothetical protein